MKRPLLMTKKRIFAISRRPFLAGLSSAAGAAVFIRPIIAEADTGAAPKRFFAYHYQETDLRHLATTLPRRIELGCGCRGVHPPDHRRGGHRRGPQAFLRVPLPRNGSSPSRDDPSSQD